MLEHCRRSRYAGWMPVGPKREGMRYEAVFT